MASNIDRDPIRETLDDPDAVIEEFERVDAALGAHLARCLSEATPITRPGWAVASPQWYRFRILEWCQDPSVRAEYSREVVESIRFAVPQLEDDELRLLVADLIERGAAGDTMLLGGRASFPGAEPDVRQSTARSHPRLRPRRR